MIDVSYLDGDPWTWVFTEDGRELARMPRAAFGDARGGVGRIGAEQVAGIIQRVRLDALGSKEDKP